MYLKKKKTFFKQSVINSQECIYIHLQRKETMENNENDYFNGKLYRLKI